MDNNGMLPDSNGITYTDIRRAQHQNDNEGIIHVKQEHGNTRTNGITVLRSQKNDASGAANTRLARGSPAKKDQKHVVFQLIDQEDPRIQARLPMRVMISAHDNTESIITTVKNFYGLYDYGVSFENKEGISIIAAYENFDNDMTVYVRTVIQPAQVNTEPARLTTSPKKPTLGAPFEARASHHGSVYSPSRHAARSAGLRSLSPTSELGRRSMSAAPGKGRAAKAKSKDNSIHGDDAYSSDDGGNASVTSSRRSKTEQVNAEISVDNIVEGGRRRPAFESSELPLFVPPQMPISASISSISPQRRTGPVYAGSPAFANQKTFSYTQPTPSPHQGVALNYGLPAHNGYSAYYQQPRPMRSRPSGGSSTHNRLSTGGIMPTPDPTVGSAISDEDVALQLMRLGDASNFSYGRTSTSTVDDALSGKAEAPTSDEDDEIDSHHVAAGKKESGPKRKKQRVMHDYSSEASSGEDYEERRDKRMAGDNDGMPDDLPDYKHKIKSNTVKNGKPRVNSFSKPQGKIGSQVKVPMSPASMAPHSRKASVASSSAYPLGPDEEDLSSKPRCQRCRKSKKGCDRQRPCGRCKDAGIGADGCVSEDEGNGRKGRYGRHMGVPVKKTDETFSLTENPVPMPGIPNGGYFLAPAPIDKSKKRKR